MPRDRLTGKREKGLPIMTDTLTDTFDYANAYAQAGWALVAIPAGSKAQAFTRRLPCVR